VSVRVTVERGRLLVETPPDRPDLKAPFAAMLAAAWDAQRSAIALPATPIAMEDVAAQAAALAAAGIPVTRSPSTGPLLEQMRACIKARDARTAEDLPDFPGRLSGWIHQRQAFWFAEPQPAAMLAMDMGTGKSKVTTGLLDHWDVQLTIILCPKSVVGVWPREFRKHSERPWQAWAGDAIGARGRLKNPSIAQRAATAEQHVERERITDRPAALVVNYESSWQARMHDLLLALVRSPRASKATRGHLLALANEGRVGVLVLDESHRVKAPGGKASKFAAQLATAVRARGGRILELTGTPMDHSPLDVFAQYRCLDPAVYGTNHGRFKKRYAITAPIGNGRAEMIVGVRPEAEPELRDRFHKLAYVCNKRDLVARGVLSIPPSTEDFRECTLGAEASRIYELLEQEFVAELEAGTITASNVMVKLLRLQQITSGHVKLDPEPPPPLDDGARVDEVTDDWDAGGEPATLTGDALEPIVSDWQARMLPGMVVEVDTAKRDLLSETIADVAHTDPIVVFARFRHDLDMIKWVAEQQGRRFGELSGRRRDALADDSTLHPDVQLAAVQIQSGGVGIDFTRASLGIYFSIGHSLGNYTQSLARLDRPGQLLPVQFLHLVARLARGSWTVDRRVYQSLEKRQGIVDAVMRRPNAGWDDQA
jgi:SNF2 family DNA or RNA helicase